MFELDKTLDSTLLSIHVSSLGFCYLHGPLPSALGSTGEYSN